MLSANPNKLQMPSFKKSRHHKAIPQSPILIASRKDKPIDNVFWGQFLWAEALDAAADVYNGVRIFLWSRLVEC